MEDRLSFVERGGRSAILAGEDGGQPRMLAVEVGYLDHIRKIGCIQCSWQESSSKSGVSRRNLRASTNSSADNYWRRSISATTGFGFMCPISARIVEAGSMQGTLSKEARCFLANLGDSRILWRPLCSILFSAMLDCDHTLTEAATMEDLYKEPD